MREKSDELTVLAIAINRLLPGPTVIESPRVSTLECEPTLVSHPVAAIRGPGIDYHNPGGGRDRFPQRDGSLSPARPPIADRYDYSGVVHSGIGLSHGRYAKDIALRIP